MPIWLVKTTWLEDETEASEQWEVSAETEQAAIEEISKHVRFRPRHIEATQQSSVADGEPVLPPGQARRLSL